MIWMRRSMKMMMMRVDTWEEMQPSMPCHLHHLQCSHSGHLQLDTLTHTLLLCGKGCLVRLRAYAESDEPWLSEHVAADDSAL
jgi:hypothetical protein